MGAKESGFGFLIDKVDDGGGGGVQAQDPICEGEVYGHRVVRLIGQC